MHFVAYLLLALLLALDETRSILAFNIPFSGFVKHHPYSLISRRATRPRQCSLVRPSPAVFAPGSGGPPEDQSPLLPGPSRAGPDTINAQSACGEMGATDKISQFSGPNGAISWLTCGLNSTGWKPSYATVSDVITADLTSALRQSNSPFQACNDYLDIIKKYAAQYQVPPILVASFAMQESGCRPDVTGEGGEQGMMQISGDKCDGAPGGDCTDPDFNIHKGTQFLADTLKNNKGNLIITIGQYNGWYEGMTYEQATARRNSSCCRCQQNLDYVFQVLNGWVLNRNPLLPPRLGVYFNLDVCG